MDAHAVKEPLHSADEEESVVATAAACSRLQSRTAHSFLFSLGCFFHDLF